jgi:hypothetical protein
VRVRDLSPAQLDAWEDLGRCAIEPNPLFEPGCLLPAARHLPNGREILLAIAEDDGGFAGCFPLERARRGRDRMPLTLVERAQLSVTTQVRRNRYDLTPLLRAGHAEDAMGALLRAVRDCRIPRPPRLLRFEAMSADGPVEGALHAAAHATSMPLYVADSWTRPVAPRRADGDYRLGSDARRKNVRELLRKQKRLAEHLGVEVTVVDRSADPGAVDELMRLERTGYKLEKGVATESWAGEPEWFRATCDAFRERGRLVVSSLEGGGRSIAMLVWLRGGDRLFGIQRAFDEELKRFSPGSLLDLLFFDVFHGMDGVELEDSCAGAAKEQSLSLYTGSRRVVTIVAPVGGPLEAVLLTRYGALRDRLQLRERVRGLMARHDRLDRFVRGGAAVLDRARRGASLRS